MYEAANSVVGRRFWRRVHKTLLASVVLLLLLLCVVAVQARRPGYTGVVKYSFAYFVLCFVGGALSGLTHLALMPVDLIKCRMQVGEYHSLRDGVRSIYVVEGRRSAWRALPHYFHAWQPTTIGYVLQGGLKFCLYELFKYALLLLLRSSPSQRQGQRRQRQQARDVVDESQSQLLVFLVASFLAEVLADIVLVPWEAIKIRMQTMPHPRSTHLRVIVPHMWLSEGVAAFYKTLVPLWLRQVPSTMVKFASFEQCVRLLHLILGAAQSLVAVHNAVVPARVAAAAASASGGSRGATRMPAQSHMSNATEVFISLLAGMLSGILCAIVSHPADTLLSRLNQRSSADVNRRATAAAVVAAGGASAVGCGVGDSSSTTAATVAAVASSSDGHVAPAGVAVVTACNDHACGGGGGECTCAGMVHSRNCNHACSGDVACGGTSSSAHAVDVVQHLQQALSQRRGSEDGNHVPTSTALLSTMVRQLGWRGLWKGIVPRMFTVAMLTALQWVVYDGFKMLVGLPGTGRSTTVRSQHVKT